MNYDLKTIYKAENMELRKALKELEEWEEAEWYEKDKYLKKYAQFMVEDKKEKFNKVLDKYEKYH